tara:strand:+ start:321 stop:1511 length:1191 start_codon:yes stop_codon:yes gene_type:complete
MNQAFAAGAPAGAEPLDLPFSVSEYRDRLGRVQAEMAERGLDLMMVHQLENTYWLTGYRTIGFYSYMVLFVPVEGEPVHLSRSIEKSVLQGTTWIPNIETYPDTENYVDATIRVMKERGWDSGQIGVDERSWYLTIADFNSLRERLPEVSWHDTSLLIEEMKLIKSPAEQEYSRKAGKAASEGMRAALDRLEPGVTEDDLMAAAYQGLFRIGSEYPGLPPLINGGVRHTMAHAMAEGNRISQDDQVYFEVGASIKRYHAATLRIGCLGEPPQLYHKLFDMCRRSLDAALEKMKPGIAAEEVDHAARSVIDDAGYGDQFRHKAGYSIGIALPPDWSEARTMMLRGGETRPLQPGMVYHLLPAVFEYKEYGVGVSETVLITEDGHEVLTNVERKLFIK